MRRLTLISVGIIFGLLFFLSQAQAAEKLGYVDLSRIFNEYGKTKEYDKLLEEKQKAYESKREKKVDEVKRIQDSLNLLSEAERESKKAGLEKKVEALRDFDRSETQILRKERDEKMAEILEDIEKVISEYAKKEGYILVFNDRVLIYQDKSLNITEDILKILQKNYSKKR